MTDEIIFHPLRSVGKDRTGERFGLWTVLGYAGDLHWWCRCECGTTKRVDIKSLKKGRSLSCRACCRREAKCRIAPPRLARIWNSMHQRCYNPKSKSFKHYGARGIGICKEWMNFKEFASWAMASGYTDHLTIERKDNDCGYSPDNCTWIPHPDQAKNRKYLIIIGEGADRTYLSAFAKRKGMTPGLLSRRLRDGWDLVDASTEPHYIKRSRDSGGRFCDENEQRRMSDNKNLFIRQTSGHPRANDQSQDQQSFDSQD